MSAAAAAAAAKIVKRCWPWVVQTAQKRTPLPLLYLYRCWTRSCLNTWIRTASFLTSTSATGGFFWTSNEVR